MHTVDFQLHIVMWHTTNQYEMNSIVDQHFLLKLGCYKVLVMAVQVSHGLVNNTLVK